VLSVRGALEARKARGGTAPERVAGQLTALKSLATAHADWSASSPVAAAL
jgi:argininosuccinate lyase